MYSLEAHFFKGCENQREEFITNVYIYVFFFKLSKLQICILHSFDSGMFFFLK